MDWLLDLILDLDSVLISVLVFVYYGCSLDFYFLYVGCKFIWILKLFWLVIRWHGLLFFSYGLDNRNLGVIRPCQNCGITTLVLIHIRLDCSFVSVYSWMTWILLFFLTAWVCSILDLFGSFGFVWIRESVFLDSFGYVTPFFVYQTFAFSS